jgi:predicted secreted acid phosphatase
MAFSIGLVRMQALALALALASLVLLSPVTPSALAQGACGAPPHYAAKCCPPQALSLDVPQPSDLQSVEEPMNLGEYKRKLTNYKCSGDYDKAVAEELDKAIGYVEQHASDAPKAALVLDIDETSLSNWPARLTSDYAFIKKGTCDLTIDGACGLEAWQLYAKDEAIGPTLKLYSLTKDKGVEVFFITGRCDTGHMREATKANLKSAGYGLVDDCKLIMRSQESCDTKLDTVVAFKEPARGEIEKQGYKIIANVGDQWSDLNGGLSEQNFKVPNPFYFIK